MLAEVKGVLQMLEDLQSDVKKQFEGVDVAGLNWVPEGEEDTNSLYAIVLHIAAAQKIIVGRMLNQKFIVDWPEMKQEGGIFKVQGESTERIFALLDESSAFVREKVAELTTEDLEQERPMRDGTIKTARWWLLHLIDHTANHLGHMELTRQLYLSRKK